MNYNRNSLRLMTLGQTKNKKGSVVKEVRTSYFECENAGSSPARATLYFSLKKNF